MMNETLAQVWILRDICPMAFRFERLETFREYRDLFTIGVEELAQYGFFYAGNAERPDQVCCFWCQGFLYDWEPFDNALEQHRALLPWCPVFGRP